MAKHKRGLAGSSPAATAGGSTASDNTNAFWVSHRQGPFLIHKVGACDPQPIDNAGYLDDVGTAINQGFGPCPKCMK